MRVLIISAGEIYESRLSSLIVWRFDIWETLRIVVPPIRRTRSAKVSILLNVDVARSSNNR